MKLPIFSFCLLFPIILGAQTLPKTNSNDLLKDKVLYTIGYSHLDTEWNWDYPATIDHWIKNIMTENFHLFPKYPDYVYNFTGARRYRMMKEYYPELFEGVKKYINEGRWFVSGSSVDEAEVNISSSESLIRQVLYGNGFFKKEFGKQSVDYMIPDCFGFVASVPTVLNHCGLLGFSTQKLTWHSANGIPFNVGVWNGPDDKGVVAALNATDYGGEIPPRLDRDSAWINRLDEDYRKYGISFDYRYYGVGDQGGAPRERDVKNAVGSLHNDDGVLHVLLTSSDQMYKDITPAIRNKLPVYKGDLLLIEHSAGSMTSQAFMKRMNRKNELLAQAAEQLASTADWMGTAGYPLEKLNNSWDLVLGSQFHDLLPGTAIPKAFEYAWNDEFIAANGFSAVLNHSLDAVSSAMDTRGEGRSVVVYNPVAKEREDLVTAELEFDRVPSCIIVYNKDGKKLPSQIISTSGHKLKFLFPAHVSSVGLSAYRVAGSMDKPVNNPSLKITERSMENEYYSLKINDKGDISSIYDKKAGKELLTGPADLEFQREEPAEWPSWNMDWKDRQKPAFDHMDQEPVIRIAEQGPLRVTLEVSRKGQKSAIKQWISLSVGEAGKRVEVNNTLDWQSGGVCLKASFPLSVANKEAIYNLGTGAIKRSNNNNVKFEVPSKEWFDLTDESGNYGVSILEDCKYGSDKPNDNTLRLTLLYTPKVSQAFNWAIYQGTQDWGIHHFRYAIYGHKGGWNQGQSYWQARFFNQPMLAFETNPHSGSIGKELSLIKISNPQVGLMAFKKMEHGDYFLVRLNELGGMDEKAVKLTFPGKITDAWEVNGQEEKIGNAGFTESSLTTDLTHYTIKSFAVKIQSPLKPSIINQTPVQLKYNQDVISFDDNRADGNFYENTWGGGISLPAELVPHEIVSEDIHFIMGSTADEANNAVTCKGQTVDLPEGEYNTIYLLAAANEDTKGVFKLGEISDELSIQSLTGFIGQFYNRQFTKDMAMVTSIDTPFVKHDHIAWFASHYHQKYPSANASYQYCYLYIYSLKLPRGVHKLTLPDNNKIKILAITVSEQSANEVKPLQPLYDHFEGDHAVKLR